MIFLNSEDKSALEFQELNSKRLDELLKLNSELGECRSSVSNLEDSLKAVKAKEAKLQSAVLKKDSELSEYSKNYVDCSEKLKQTRRDLEIAVDNNSSLSIEVQTLRSQISGVQSERDIASTQVEESMEKLKNLHGQYSDAIVELKTKLEGSQFDNQKLQRDLDAARLNELKFKDLADSLRIDLRGALMSIEELKEQLETEQSSSAKLIELYKNSYDDEHKQTTELTETINVMTQNHKSDMEDALKRIDELENELKSAQSTGNRLFLTSSDLSDNDAIHVSASEGLVNVSKQQLFSQLVSTSEQLQRISAEKSQLELFVAQVKEEIAQSAPSFKRQQEENESLKKSFSDLQDRFLSVSRENSDNSDRISTLEKSVKSLQNENKQLNGHNEDLSRQICHLLRRDLTSAAQGTDAQNVSPLHFFTQNLVVFNDIEELQKRNRELLAYARQVSEANETLQKEQDENVQHLLRQYMEKNQAENQELEERYSSLQQRLEIVVSENLKLRATLDESKSLAVRNSSPRQSLSPSKSVVNYEQLLQESKQEREYMHRLVENTDALRRDILQKFEDSKKAESQLRSEKTSLAIENAQFKERAELSKRDLEKARFELDLLEKRCHQFMEISIKHEQLVESLRLELRTSHENLATVRAQYNANSQRLKDLLDAESSITAEKNRLISEKALLLKTIDDLKHQSGSNDNVALANATEKISGLEAEIASLKKQSEEYKNLYTVAIDEKRKAVEGLKNDLKEALEQSREFKSKFEALNAETKASENSSNAVMIQSSGSVLASVSSDFADAVNLSRMQKLELECSSLQKQTRSLLQQLQDSELQSSKWKQAYLMHEEQLKLVSHAGDELAKKLNARIQELTDQKDSLQDRVRELTSMCKEADQNLLEVQGKAAEEVSSAQALVSSLSDEITILKSQINSLEQALSFSKHECTRQSGLTADAENKYERMVLEYSSEVQKIQDLKSEVAALKNEISLKAADLTSLRSEYDSVKFGLSKEVVSQKEFINSLSTTVNSLQEENSMLLQRLESSSSESSTTGSIPIEFTEVLGRLRRENDLLRSSAEMHSQNLESLKSKVSKLTKENQELLSSLDLALQRVQSNESQDSIKSLSDELGLVKETNAYLRQELGSKRAQLQSLQDDVKSREEEILSLKARVSDLEATCKNASTEAETSKKEVEQFRDRIQVILKKYGSIDPQVHETLQKEYCSAQTQIKTLNENLESLKKEKGHLEQLLKSKQVELNNMSNELESLKKEFEAKLAAARQESSGSADNMYALENQTQQMKKVIKDANTRVSNLSEELEKAKKELDSASQGKIALESRVRALTEALEKARILVHTWKARVQGLPQTSEPPKPEVDVSQFTNKVTHYHKCF